jgi:hypothetical protein
MRGQFRRSMLAVLALLFAGSGVLAQYCMVAHHDAGRAGPAQAVALAPQSHHGHGFSQSPHAGHADVGHAAAHTNTGPAHAHQDTAHVDPGFNGHATMDDIACAKCCSNCTLVTAALADATAEAIFTVSPAVFASRPDHASGTSIRVDPGIPKRTA